MLSSGELSLILPNPKKNNTALPGSPEAMSSAISVWSATLGDSSMKISYSMTCSGVSESVDEMDNIDNLVKLRIKGNAIMEEGQMKFGFSISISKDKPAKCQILKISITSTDLACHIENVIVPDNWSEWQLMGWQAPIIENSLFSSLLTIIITVIEDQKDTISSKLYTDTDFIDFNLATAEGSVPVHKVCLAANSDVFRAMLTKEWKETNEGQINMKGVTVQTLQHLKDYMYLGTVPNEGLEPLLLVARLYLIEDLEKKCIKKLSESVSAENLFSLVQFACDNNVPELVYALLVVTQDHVVTNAHELYRKMLEKQSHVKEQK